MTGGDHAMPAMVSPVMVSPVAGAPVSALVPTRHGAGSGTRAGDGAGGGGGASCRRRCRSRWWRTVYLTGCGTPRRRRIAGRGEAGSTAAHLITAPGRGAGQ